MGNMKNDSRNKFVMVECDSNALLNSKILQILTKIMILSCFDDIDKGNRQRISSTVKIVQKEMMQDVMM